MQRVIHEDMVYYQFDSWVGLKHGLFTRLGGVSQAPWASLNVGGTVGDNKEAVRKNHELMYRALDANEARACTVWMVHGHDVIVVDEPVQDEDRHWLAKADSMITHRKDTPLVMRYADCTPIMYYDRVKRVIGIAHAGWRGTVQGIASRTVRTMVETYGCELADIECGIGPAIGPKQYQVGEEVVEAVEAYFNTTEGLIRRDLSDGTAYLDLWRANQMDLECAGIEKIQVAGICTADNTHEFFSHRAENGQTGRFGAIISL